MFQEFRQEDIGFQAPDEDKKRGLYVDLGRPTGQPEDVEEVDVALALATLEGILRTLRHLQATLDDPSEWAEVVDDVDRRRNDPGPVE